MAHLVPATCFYNSAAGQMELVYNYRAGALLTESIVRKTNHYFDSNATNFCMPAQLMYQTCTVDSQRLSERQNFELQNSATMGMELSWQITITTVTLLLMTLVWLIIYKGLTLLNDDKGAKWTCQLIGFGHSIGVTLLVYVFQFRYDPWPLANPGE